MHQKKMYFFVVVMVICVIRITLGNLKLQNHLLLLVVSVEVSVGLFNYAMVHFLAGLVTIQEDCSHLYYIIGSLLTVLCISGAGVAYYLWSRSQKHLFNGVRYFWFNIFLVMYLLLYNFYIYSIYPPMSLLLNCYL